MNVGMCAHVESVLVSILCDTNAATHEDMDDFGMLGNRDFVVISDADYEKETVPEVSSVDGFC